MDITTLTVSGQFPENLSCINNEGIYSYGDYQFRLRHHTDGKTVMISVKQPDPINCTVAMIEFDSVSEPGWLMIGQRRKFPVPGSVTLDICCVIAKMFHFSICLEDTSYKMFNGIELDLKLLCLLRTGQSWYERHGFTPVNGRPDQLITQFRQYPVKQVITDLNRLTVDLNRLTVDPNQIPGLDRSIVVNDDCDYRVVNCSELINISQQLVSVIEKHHNHQYLHQLVTELLESDTKALSKLFELLIIWSFSVSDHLVGVIEFSTPLARLWKQIDVIYRDMILADEPETVKL
jgi:hypothetical protein